ncbi:hypothetical protein BDV96DRAFT_645685 [Lophiotrema nucula]|uniref:Mid2 domain-containing protein n=1 Tax=Lophiotrema nucula TaxID=690887 RepID=A0A6A5ZDB2_9PLEO|nr:hypothetical protein BDV96DRAFT_645685 [Lophiotrema nucula]
MADEPCTLYSAFYFLPYCQDASLTKSSSNDSPLASDGVLVIATTSYSSWDFCIPGPVTCDLSFIANECPQQFSTASYWTSNDIVSRYCCPSLTSEFVNVLETSSGLEHSTFIYPKTVSQSSGLFSITTISTSAVYCVYNVVVKDYEDKSPLGIRSEYFTIRAVEVAPTYMTSTSPGSTTAGFSTHSASTPLHNSLNDSSSLSTGAKAGIGVGVGIGGLIIIISSVYLILALRRKRKRLREAPGISDTGYGKPELRGDALTREQRVAVSDAGYDQLEPHGDSAFVSHAGYNRPGLHDDVPRREHAAMEIVGAPVYEIGGQSQLPEMGAGYDYGGGGRYRE